jgi:hypothetical protein
MKHTDPLRLEALRLASSIALQKSRVVDTHTHGHGLVEHASRRSCDALAADSVRAFAKAALLALTMAIVLLAIRACWR